MGRKHAGGWINAVLVVLLGASVLATSPMATAQTGNPGTFDPAPGSVSLGPRSVFSQVAASGDGTFHSIARTDFLGSQRIVYRRSGDGGRTWAIGQYFEGRDGGATRPALAAFGDDVAVAFIGLWCDSTSGQVLCEEAPYLSTSIDRGQTWTPPRRLARQAFEVRVAVDPSGVWVAWEEGGSVQLRGTDDGGRTFFATTSRSGRAPQLAAGDGAMVLAMEGINSPRGPVVPVATVALGRTLRPWVSLSADPVTFGSWSTGVTAADGRVHVLLADPERGPSGATGNAPRRLLVVSSDADGAFGGPVPVAPVGHSASIAATEGVVAVAVASADGITSVATSADGGRSYTAPLPISYTPGREPQVAIGAAVPGEDRAHPRFDWTVEDRYVDDTGDGRPDPANSTGIDSLDELRVAGNRNVDVRLDGCASAPATGRSITSYSWYVGGVLETADSACTATIEMESGAKASVRLTVEDDQGVQTSVTQDVTPRDLVVVSIGDSIASGEGSPHLPGGVNLAASWQDGPCHRSAYAGPALAARRLEQADPRSSVTFIQLSCSGAAIVDTAATPGSDGPDDDPDTGGLLDEYQGVEPAVGSLRPSQLAQLQTLVGGRSVDALMVSIGANDVRFSDTIKSCLKEPSCDTSSTAATYDARIAGLPSRYSRLADAIDAINIAPDDVFLTEYFDPTLDDNSLPNLRCAVNPSAIDVLQGFSSVFDEISRIVAAATTGGLLDDDEARWARDRVMGQLNAAGVAASQNHGWTYVGGIARQFDRHGYCATDHHVVQLAESLLVQRNVDGAFHPNRAGQETYAGALFPALRLRLAVPVPSGDPTGAVVGPASVGDLAVVTATVRTVTSATFRSTGGTPVPGVVRRLDRVTSGDGFFGGARPAIDRNAIVGTWVQASGFGQTETQALVTQIGIHPNVAVESVRLVQAPADGSRIVAARDTYVLATVDASVAAPVTVDVTTTVSGTSEDGGEQMLFLPVTEPIELNPGRNVLLLPVDRPFRADPDVKVEATVRVTDPLGATEDDASDNEARAAGPTGVESLESRRVDVAIGRLDVGAATVGCVATGAVGSRQVAFATAAMPVAEGGLGASLFCSPIPGQAQTRLGVASLLVELDEQARLAGLDAVVAVVPDGWLSSAAEEAVGIAAAGLRGVIIESGSPDHTLAHELTHSLGFADHIPETPAFGARVDLNALREGIDWMFFRTPPAVWTGGATWDSLFDRLGGPGNEPVPMVLDGDGMWVRGTIDEPPGQPPRLSDDAFLQDTNSPSPDLDDLELERLVATPVDAAGVPLDEPIRIGLAPVEGLYGPGVLTEPSTPASTFAQRLALPPGTAAISFELDGELLAVRPLSVAPQVTMTEPTASTAVGRGGPLTISWTIDDPDSTEHTSNVLVSTDGGAAWRPLVSGLTGETVTLPLPGDVGGTNVRVRVVVSDGTRFGSATSASFSAEPVGGALVERVVFQQAFGDGFNTNTASSALGIADPDGTDAVLVPLPMDPVPNSGGGTWPAEHTNPAWSPDGQRIYFVSVMPLPGQVVGNVNDGLHIWSVQPDGADLRLETPAVDDADFWNTPATSREVGRGCIALARDGSHMAWMGVTDQVWVADRSAAGWTNARTVTVVGEPTYPSSIVPASYPRPAAEFVGLVKSETTCPSFSPDGQSIALQMGLAYETTDTRVGARFVTPGSTGVVAVFPVAGGLPVITTDAGGFTQLRPGFQFLVGNDIRTVDWEADGTMFVTLDRNAVNQFGGALPGVEPAIYDQATGVATPLGPLFVADLFGGVQAPFTYLDLTLRRSSGGVVRGNVQCGMFEVDPVTGVPEVVIGTNVYWNVSQPLCRTNFRSGDASTAPPPPPIIDIEPGSAPPDPNAPTTPTEPTAPTPVSEDDAPGADAPGDSPSTAVDRTFTVPTGEETPIQLPTSSGDLAPIEIVEAPSVDDVALRVQTRDVGEFPTTGLDGVVGVTPQPGFTGRVLLRFRVMGSDTIATATIDAVAPPPPILRDDELTVPAGEETVIEPEVLLANDDAGAAPIRLGSGSVPSAAALDEPAPAAGLEIVSVFGSTSGRAWLDTSGRVRILPAAGGSSTFTYAAVNAAGVTGSGTVRVVATQAPSPTTAPPTSAPPPTAPAATVPAATVPAATVPAATNPAVSPFAGQPPAAPSGGAIVPAGGLPQTGASIAGVLIIAAFLLGVGSLLVASRRRSPQR